MTGIELIDQILNILKSSDTIERYESVISRFEQRKEQWSKNKIRIGVIGVTSSGKSTMINSILGDKILSMAVRPSSSQLVSCSQSKEKIAKVFFENQKVITLKGRMLNETNIKKYSDENYNSKNKEKVVQIELSTPAFELGKDVVLIDSPGLDAYGLENHEALTMEVLLPTIDVCIFVTTLKNNSDEKMRVVLNLIAKYNCQILIVQNMLDSLQASVDGKKNVKEVALEHRNRVQRIIDNSNIKNKKSVKIVQISAIEALDARCDNKLSDKEKHTLLEKSNYKILVEEVKEMLKRERPNIENQRLTLVKEDVEKIINEAKEDIQKKTSMDEIKFEYEGLDIELKKEAEITEEKLFNLLKILEYNEKNNSNDSKKESFTRNLFGILRKKEKDITEEDIKNLKNKVKKVEKNIIKVIGDFNIYLKKVANKLNIPPRDIISVNGLPSMPDLNIKTKSEVRTRTVKKSGFGGKVGRFFGKIFNNDWGYEKEQYTVTIVDNALTKKEIEQYMNRAKKMYSKEINEWCKKTKVPIDQLLEQIDNRKEAFEERKKVKVENEKLKKLIDELYNIIRNITTNKGTNFIKKEEIKENISSKLTVERFTKSAYGIAKISEHLSDLINKTTNDVFLKNNNAINNEWIIVGWDILSITTFAKRFCGILFMEDMRHILEDIGEFIIWKYKFYFNPCKEKINEFMSVTSNKNIYILTNATQYGSAKNQIFKSGICNFTLEKDILSFVVQDFIELINGRGVIEAIQNMNSITKDLNINHEAFILINHNNPIYNLAMIEAQTNKIKIEKEEAELLKEIQKHFRYLRDEKIDIIIDNIIRGMSIKEKI